MSIYINLSKFHAEALKRALGPELGRIALEALAIQGYRTGELSLAHVSELLDISDSRLTNQWLADRMTPLRYIERATNAPSTENGVPKHELDGSESSIRLAAFNRWIATLPERRGPPVDATRKSIYE